MRRYSQSTSKPTTNLWTALPISSQNRWKNSYLLYNKIGFQEVQESSPIHSVSASFLPLPMYVMERDVDLLTYLDHLVEIVQIEFIHKGEILHLILELLFWRGKSKPRAVKDTSECQRSIPLRTRPSRYYFAVCPAGLNCLWALGATLFLQRVSKGL